MLPNAGRAFLSQIGSCNVHSITIVMPTQAALCCKYNYPSACHSSTRTPITQHPLLLTFLYCPVRRFEDVFFTAVLEGRSQLTLPLMHLYFSHLLPAATCQSDMIGRQELLSVCIAERLYSFWPF